MKYDVGGSDPGLSSFHANVAAANDIMRQSKFGRLSIKAKSYLHLTLAYLCCLSSGELSKLETVLSSDNCGTGWPVHRVRFTGAVLRYNKPGKFSIIAMVRPQDEDILQQFAIKFEECLQKSEVDIEIPRRHQWAFHVTLADGFGENEYAAEAALAEVNALEWGKDETIMPARPHL